MICIEKFREFNLQGKYWQQLQNSIFHQCQHIGEMLIVSFMFKISSTAAQKQKQMKIISFMFEAPISKFTTVQ